MKKEIKREELKSNFLKQTILRLDYDYLFDEDIEIIRKNMNKFLINRDYKMNSKTLEEINFNFDIDKINNNSNGIDLSRKEKEEYVSFVNDKGNIVIDITRKFATMTINYQENLNFEKIIEIFNEITNQVKNIREKINLNRIGIRKINMYFLKNLQNINNYFEESLFSFNELIDKNDIKVKRQVESFSYNKYKVNQNSFIEKGNATNSITGQRESICRIALDIDVYDDVMEDNNIDLEQINLIIFEIYKSNLKENFLEDLKKENYSSEEIFK